MGDAADVVRRFSCCTLSNKYMNANKKQITKYNLRGKGKRLTTILKKSILLK